VVLKNVSVVKREHNANKKKPSSL